MPGTIVMLEQVDKAWQKAIYEIGEYNRDQVIVYFPHEPAEAIYVCTDMYAGTWRDVYLDQYTLEELPGSKPKFKDERFAASMSRLNYGLHVGEVGGLTTKIMYFAASLICASLPVTGFYIWWGKKRKTKRVTKKRRKAPEAEAYA